MSRRNYKGESIAVSFDLKTCIHAGRCLMGSPDVFNLDKKPWIQPDEGEAEKLIKTIKRCPSGALQYQIEDASKMEAPGENKVTIRPNGPLFVRGDINVDGADTCQTRLSLCRCGKSKNKPYCDNAHKEAGFKDPGKPVIDTSKIEELVAVGDLDIKQADNGPLLLTGNFEVFGASGDMLFSGTKAALCRCGASENKPFCDGRHKEIGFTSI